jgi:hypothetical protein
VLVLVVSSMESDKSATHWIFWVLLVRKVDNFESLQSSTFRFIPRLYHAYISISDNIEKGGQHTSANPFQLSYIIFQRGNHVLDCWSKPERGCFRLASNFVSISRASIKKQLTSLC